MKSKVPRIAILGWGSLLWDQNSNVEFDKLHEAWHFDGPKLPLEFSKISVNRHRALTLIVDPFHGSYCQVAWCLSVCGDVDSTVSALMKREGTSDRKKIGVLSIAKTKREGAIDSSIRRWAIGKNLDFVVWTAFESSFETFSVKIALKHLETLSKQGKSEAVKYIRNAPEFVQTKVRKAVEDLPWFAEKTEAKQKRDYETLKVFYSWQSDLPANWGRSFIKTALQGSIKSINKEFVIEESVRDTGVRQETLPRAELDHDTKGVRGTPDLAATIFQKIDASDVFIADVSFVGRSCDSMRSLPNPNVLIELGYALAMLGSDKVVLVMDTKYGQAEELPFDLRHKRHPIQYSSDNEKGSEQKVLVQTFINALSPYVMAHAPRVSRLPLNQNPSREAIFDYILNSDSKRDWSYFSTPGWKDIAYYNPDVNLRMEIVFDEDGKQNDDFREEWANSFPDSHATGYWVMLWYGNTWIEKFVLVSVDGGRARLPVPESREFLAVSPLNFKVAQIFDTGGSMMDYFYRGKLMLGDS